MEYVKEKMTKKPFQVVQQWLTSKGLQAGRSSYVSSDILASVADPGAMAAASWYKAAALAVKNKCKGVDE